MLRRALQGAQHAARHGTLPRIAPQRSVATEAAGAYSAAAPLRVCVVGSGPAGFYTADRLLHRFGDAVRVDILERLPVPFGLVRFGVAPDHPDTKSVTSKFERVAADPRCGLLLGVEAGGATGVPLPELRRRYHAVVLATGAPGDRPLRVPGAALRGCLSARAFVEWYNGHPEAAPLFAPNSGAIAPNKPGDLAAGDTAVIFGLGNVALDCARVLLRPTAELASTDIAARALAALRASAVRRVLLVARRGPAQAACTPKELRELLSLPGLRVTVEGAPLPLLASLPPEDAAELATSRPRRRAVEELDKALRRTADADAASGGDAPSAAKVLCFLFMRTPDAILPDAADATRVGAVRLERTALSGPAGSRVASGIGIKDVHAASLVLSSIGYAGAPTPGAPFDAATATLPHDAGAVRGAGAGLFAAGWAKRGPSGIIGTNLQCAEETVATLAAHAAAGLLPAPEAPGGVEQLAELAAAAGGSPLTLDDWRRIDAAERAAGEAAGKPREKAASLAELRALARGG